MTLTTGLAVALGQSVAAAITLSHAGSATSLPGKIALKLDTDLLGHLAQQIEGPRVVITGTNGKSTTAGILAECLQRHGHHVVHNLLGANMHAGLTTALLRQSSWTGRLKADSGVFEVDEASMPFCSQAIDQSLTVVTNLFRDQLDRYGELDTTANFIRRGIQESKGQLLLNADDPMVTYLAHGIDPSRVHYFGIQSVDYPGIPELAQDVPFSREVMDCPACQQELVYSRFILGHLGHYACTQCDFKRPSPTIWIEHLTVSAQHSQAICQTSDEQPHTLMIPLPGVYNAYNALAAMACANQLPIPWFAIESGISVYHGIFGRAEKMDIAGKSVMMLLIKNPMGASEVLKVVSADSNARVLIMINDNYADGRDVSWLWDAPFEYLATHHKPLLVSGQRAEDMAVRLMYAGVRPDLIVIEPDMKRAIHQAAELTRDHETLYVLPTYTVLLELSKMLGRR